MCRQLTQELPRDARSPRAGREHVLSVCHDWQLDAICDDLALPVSELVTNAVVHAGTDVRLTVSLTGTYIEVAVRDHDRRPPIRRPVHLDADPAAPDQTVHSGFGGVPDAEGLGGRGLFIVNAVADEWGIAQYSDGKDLWFRIRTPHGWQPSTACTCPGGFERTPGGLPFADTSALHP